MNVFAKFIAKFFLGIGLAWLVIILVHHYIFVIKEDTYRCQYENAWDCITTAIISFYEEKHYFPWEDKNHSWRVHILPYLNESQLYHQIHMDEPWNSDYNQQFHTQCPNCYQFILPQESFFPEKTRFSVLIPVKCQPSNSLTVIQLIDNGRNYSWMDPSGDCTWDEVDLSKFQSKKISHKKIKFTIYYQMLPK